MSELPHPETRSVEAAADLYDRTRPSYPEIAVSWLAEQLRIHTGTTVVDLGAGTGKLTRELVQRGPRVIAVEPGTEMLAQLRRDVPEAQAVRGGAEAIPLGDDTVDSVVCGQSFHWFRHGEALDEIHRVLRAGGGLGLIWNLRARDSLQRGITALLGPFVPSGRPLVQSSLAALVAHDAFGDIETHVASFEQQLDAEAVVARIASISFVAAAPEARRHELEAALRALLAQHEGRVTFRYVTEAYVTFTASGSDPPQRGLSRHR